MQGCNIISALMNSAAGDSCYFVMTVVGHGLIFFFFFLWEECWRGKRRRQRADSCMDEERVISPCSSFSTTLNASFVGFVANGLSL